MPDHLRDELRQRYLARAILFWKCTKDSKFAKLQQLARSAAWMNLSWDRQLLGITDEAASAAQAFGFVPTEVFVHPDVVNSHPELFEYYRLLACLPRKGMAQIKTYTSSKDYLARCVLLNGFISELISNTSRLTRELVLRTLFAEAGSEWQGTWVNNIGLVAAQQLEKLIVDYARSKQLVDDLKTQEVSESENTIVLKSGTTITFGSEPDVECRNAQRDLLCVMEIKGSADKAGAQSRLGETKKSFTKAKTKNPRCVTIFLPTIVTPAVEDQLRTERDIDKVFNLLAIFKDAGKQEDFLKELFTFILREPA